ncbi:hypothetical protein GQ57_07675 [Burkholderia sp. MSh2]|nr:hypothetical protein GQ57_07675 [Burkholderia sp. MSh2]KFG97827.1 hypothetical protein GQ56_0107990 [Burkholderia paludis]
MQHIASLPFAFASSGYFGAAGTLFFYALVAAGLVTTLFKIANFAGVGTQTGTASVMTKRVVPAHWAWRPTGQSPIGAYIEEHEILDLIIKDRKLTYRPIPWIMERTTANTTEPIQFKVGRFNGAIQVTKFKYL